MCRVADSSHLPRRLSEIRSYATGASASLNPNLACTGCPNTDTRTEITDTQVTPWDAVGLLARQDANSISKCVAGLCSCPTAFDSTPAALGFSRVNGCW